MSASLSHSATSWVPPGRNAGQAAPSGADICSAEAARGAAGGRAGGGGSAARMLPLPPSGAAGCAQCLSCPTGRLGVTPQPHSSICTSFSRAAGRWDTHRSPPPPHIPPVHPTPLCASPSQVGFVPSPAQNRALWFFFHAPALHRAPTAAGGGFKCPPRPILSTGIPPGGKEVPLLAWGIPMAAAFPPRAAAAIPKAPQHLQHFGFPAERAFVDSTHTSAGRGKGRNQSSPPHPMLWAEDEAAAQHPRTEPLPALGTAAWRGTAGPPASPRDLGGGCTHNPTSLTGGGCGAAGIIPIPAPIELPSGSRRPNPHPAGRALLL